jgi:head-tail adaptor
MLKNSTRPIGAFDQQATILAPSESTDGAGQVVATFTAGETLWCREVRERGYERFAGEQFVGKSALMLELREYRGYITTLYRMRYRGQDWQVHDVRVVGRNEGLELSLTVRSE